MIRSTLTRPTLTRNSPSILPVIPQRTTGPGPWKDAKSLDFAFGQDVAPSHTGLVIGCLGGLGNLFAAGFMPVAGWISQGRSGFTPNFIIIGLLPLAGLATLLAFWRQDDTKPAWTDR
jgi:hypothetical protein